jgi:hypothetical protein
MSIKELKLCEQWRSQRRSTNNSAELLNLISPDSSSPQSNPQLMSSSSECNDSNSYRKTVIIKKKFKTESKTFTERTFKLWLAQHNYSMLRMSSTTSEPVYATKFEELVSGTTYETVEPLGWNVIGTKLEDLTLPASELKEGLRNMGFGTLELLLNRITDKSVQQSETQNDPEAKYSSPYTNSSMLNVLERAAVNAGSSAANVAAAALDSASTKLGHSHLLQRHGLEAARELATAIKIGSENFGRESMRELSDLSNNIRNNCILILLIAFGLWLAKPHLDRYLFSTL